MNVIKQVASDEFSLGIWPHWRAFGGAVCVAMSVYMVATVERQASTEDSLIKARVFVFFSHTATARSAARTPLSPGPKPL